MIIGGGPGGCTTAMFLLKAGIKPLIIEKSSFPRYHIGESLTGGCANILRRLGIDEQMTARNEPVKYGVHVFGPGGKNRFWVPVMERTDDGLRPNLTWQTRRSDFDKMLLDTAVERGAEYMQCEAVEPIIKNGEVSGVVVRDENGNLINIEAKVLVDASGQNTFLARKGVVGDRERGNFDKQISIFSQVTDAVRDQGDERDNTLIFYQKKHHWAWFIPLDERTVSVGVTVPASYFKSKKLSKADFLKKELVSLNSELAKRVLNLDLTEETRAVSNYSYHIRNFTGKGYLCVGDAHRFIDPIFSFGVFFAMQEGEFAAEAIFQYLDGRTGDAENPFADYEAMVDQGQDVLQTLLDTFWNHPLAFVVMAQNRHRDEIIDYFAGRVYGQKAIEGKALASMRKLTSSSSVSA